MKTYKDKIPASIKRLIEKDFVKLGKVIEREPNNKVKIAKLVQKLDKDSMKIGEAIYKGLD